MIGTVLDDRYRVLAKLGEGGFGQIYLVEHVLLRRKEALKVLHRELAADAALVDRFRREARVASQLQHPHIVALHDVGQLSDGRLFFSMEYAAGETVQRVLEREHTLAVGRALHLLDQLAEALAHAHGRDIVHRDLKPANLVLTERRGRKDYLKVLDFGLAKILHDEERKPRLTIEGEVFGTPAYMAPEQCIGRDVDARTDVYAIGCIAFELVAGTPPFVGSHGDLIAMHTHDAPEPPSVRAPAAEIPHELDLVILRCLEKRPERRFRDAAELVEALQGVPRPATPATAHGRTQAKTILDLGPIDEERATAATEDLRRQVVRDLTQLVATSAGASPAAVAAYRELRRLDDELQLLEVDLVATEAVLDDAEQVAREESGPLRFAIGELRFDRTDALLRGSPIGDLDYQIVSLEERLKAVDAAFQRDRDRALLDFARLTAARTLAGEAVDAHLLDVETLVEEAAKRSRSPRAPELLATLDDLRVALRAAGRTAT